MPPMDSKAHHVGKKSNCIKCFRIPLELYESFFNDEETLSIFSREIKITFVKTWLGFRSCCLL